MRAVIGFGALFAQALELLRQGRKARHVAKEEDAAHHAAGWLARRLGPGDDGARQVGLDGALQGGQVVAGGGQVAGGGAALQRLVEVVG